MLMTVNMPGVPNADVCSDCMYNLASWMEEKEEELKDDDKRF